MLQSKCEGRGRADVGGKLPAWLGGVGRPRTRAQARMGVGQGRQRSWWRMRTGLNVGRWKRRI